MMSFYEPFAEKPKIEGTIEINPLTDFAYFSMQKANIWKSFHNTMKEINSTLKEKQILANVSFCSFENHDGENFCFLSYWGFGDSGHKVGLEMMER